MILRGGHETCSSQTLQHHVTVDVFLFPNFSHLSFFSRHLFLLLVPTSVFPTAGPTAAIRVCLQAREVMEAAKIDRRNPQKNTKFQAPRPRPYWQCRLPRSPNDWVPAGSPESFVSPVFNIDHFLTNPPPMTLGSHVFLRFFLCKGLLRDYGVFFLRSYFFGGLPLDSYQTVK